jgi:mono/diheme cytochrome c family protein
MRGKTMHENNGSRTKLKVAAILALFSIAGITIVEARVSAERSAANETGYILTDGGSDYSAHCSRCHGGDGRGQTAKGRQTHAGDLTQSHVSDAKGIRMITNGSGEMPSFKKSMSPEQIRGVMSYIHGFRR